MKFIYFINIIEIVLWFGNLLIKLCKTIDNKLYLVENNKLILEDTNKVLNNYKSNYKITEDNKLILENISKTTNTITLEKNYNNYLNPHIFYHSPNSQNLITIGNLENEIINLNINIINTNININKIDKDTKIFIHKVKLS